MADLSSGNRAKVQLDAGQTLRVEAEGGTTTVTAIYGAPSGVTAVTGSASFGPYGVPAVLDVRCVSGVASYATVRDEIPAASFTASQVVAAQAMVSEYENGTLGGGGTWEAVTFSTSIPLDGNKVMPAQDVTSATAFSPVSAGQKAGASCYVRLRSNGSVVPTFSGFTETADSHGWANISGTVHMVQFWWDGVTAYYCTRQEVGIAIVNPVLVSAVIPTAAATTIVLTFSVALASSYVPAASAFTVTNSGAGGYTVSSVAVSGSTCTLTMGRAAISTDTVTVAYTVPGTNALQHSSGGLVATFSAQSVNNQVTPADGLVFSALAAMTESQPTAYKTYTATGDAPWAHKAASPSKYLPASPASDVWFQATLSGLSQLIGLHSDAASDVNVFSPITHQVYWDTGPAYVISGWTSVNSVTPAVGDVVRLRRTSANLLVFEVSKDSGATWTTRATKTGVTGNLYPRLNCDTTGLTFGDLKCNGTAV